MSDICEEINDYYNGMKVYAKALFDTNFKEFIKSDKYQENAEQIQKYLDILKDRIKDVFIANRELDYEPVSVLIAYHLSQYLVIKDNETLVKLFSEYNF